MSQNQCDGCNAHAPTYTKDGVTYHRMGDARYADVMACQAGKYATPSRDPNAPMDPADLASLMSTEPLDADEIKRKALLAGYGGSTPKERSMAARIQALEGVLVTIRGRASSAVLAAMAAEPSPPERVGSCVSTCDGIVILINETLDPHQPWCRDENHQGACISDPEERDDGE